MVDFRFYLIGDRTLCGGHSLGMVLNQACGAGVRAIQIREKDLSTPDLLKLTREVQRETAESQPLVMVNSNLDVALTCRTQGIHIPEFGVPAQPLRDCLPVGTLIARSTHSLGKAQEAETEGVDFITFGPVYDTPSKAAYGPAKGLKALAEIVKEVTIPVFALGGVNPERVSECLEAGAHGVAAISAILSKPDIPMAVEEFENSLGSL